MSRNDTEARIRAAAVKRILVIDGAMGTMLQAVPLAEADFRGERFRDHPRDVAGDPDLLNLTRPEVIARASNAVFYPNANKDADALVDKAVKSDPDIYPPPEVLKTLFTITPYNQASQRLLNRAWVRIKRGK